LFVQIVVLFILPIEVGHMLPLQFLGHSNKRKDLRLWFFWS